MMGFYMKDFFALPREICQNRKMIYKLAKKRF
jgi:hypothetical protein